METNKQISITGIVQGVGFRPFIYQLALEHKLNGFVQNNTSGVYIELEGNSQIIADFLSELPLKIPKVARIDSLEIIDGKYKSYTNFEIVHSQNSDKKNAIISPDMDICDECLLELNSKNNRRYKYPLINCTQCGPRYSITSNVPYDRKNTSMHIFEMCKACKSEYTNPLNRRYHAQPISCYDCGPTLKLYKNSGEVLSTGKESVAEVARYLKEGCIVALKGIGGFHLMCDATNESAVSELRERKKRSKKPFAVMFENLQSAKEHVVCNVIESELLESKEKPIVLLEKNNNTILASNIAPDITRLGVMLAYTPLHHLVFEHIDFPLVATSANRREEPIYRKFEQIQENLANVVDVILDINRDIVNAIDDSVLQVIDGRTQIIRLGRGFGPMSIPLNFVTDKKILAVGAQQKNTVALAFNDTIIISPHIGDLHSLDAFEYFERTIKTFENFYDFKAELIVCDKHPHYMSKRWAKEQSVEIIEIQHHYAHVLACMIEHQLDEKVLAFSFDGTGYGDDATIWGGEVMVCDYSNYKRIGHSKPFPLLGGEKSIKEPCRMALSMLFESYDLEQMSELNLALLSEFTQSEVQTLYQVWKKALNSPLTSSIGRLFDVVASLMGVLQKSDYEGQSGLLLESLCYDENARVFKYEINNGIINFNPMIREIVDLVLESNVDAIADRFINTLIGIMDDFANKYPKLPIVFSGGVFQNKILLQRAIKHFDEKGRRYYMQERTPINDGGISLGQLAYALKNQKDKRCIL